MLGIGGGVVVVPTLLFVFQVPLDKAVPASLMCVVASSCGAAASYVENRLADVRLVMPLELATVSGALLGGLLVPFLAPAWVALGFGVFTLYVALQTWLFLPDNTNSAVPYVPQRYPLGVAGAVLAGGVSSVLGVGGGALKVPLMALGMRVPFRIATASSNLMVGVTGAASVMGYAWRGSLDLSLVAPLVVGVLAGARLGAHWAVRAPVVVLKRAFSFVLVAVSAQMLWKGGQALWPNRF
jgi:uncharacterized membrane protein YfcA